MPFNLAGCPALAIPVPSRGRLPASLQLVGPPGSEEAIVAAGAALLFSGHGAAGPTRRRLGLGRCRAVAIEAGAVGERALGLLGALDVPVVTLPVVRSEVVI